MSQLLQRLLNDRENILLLYQNRSLCSCGEQFENYTDAENHLVIKHPRRHHDHEPQKNNLRGAKHGNQDLDPIESEKNPISKPFKGLPFSVTRQSTKLCDDKEKHLKMHLKCIENILNDSQNVCHFDNEIGRGVNDPQKRVADGSNVSYKSPFNKQKIVPVLLEEDDLESGHIKDVECCMCRKQATSFQELRQHFLKDHPGSWTYESTDVVSIRPKSFLAGWSYRYYCPIPGCGHHILSTLGNEQGANKVNDNGDENDASNAIKEDELKILSKGKSKSIHFPHVTALKQHYSKVHAHRGLACDVCNSKNAIFSTPSQLQKHKQTLCGKEFICTTCNRQYGGLEHLQTHCRRKGHTLPAHLFSHIRNKRSNLHDKSEKSLSGPLVGGNIVYQPVLMSKSIVSSDANQPLILRVLPSNITTTSSTISIFDQQTQKETNSTKTKRKAEVNTTEIGKEVAAKIFVKIAPKPIYQNPNQSTLINPRISHPSNFVMRDVALSPIHPTLPSTCQSYSIEPNVSSLIKPLKATVGVGNVSATPTSNNPRSEHCPVQLSAAIALSELASNAEIESTCTTMKGEDDDIARNASNEAHEYSKRTLFDMKKNSSNLSMVSGVGASGTTLLLSGPSPMNRRVDVQGKPLTNTLHVQCPDWTSDTSNVSCLIPHTEEQETQTLKSDRLLSANETNTRGLITAWTGVAATQTSPGNVRLSDVGPSASDLLTIFADASTATSPEPKSMDEDSMLRPFQRDRSRTTPRIGDIEQFSTETQTDDFDLLKIAQSEEVVSGVRGDNNDDDEDPFTSFKRQLIEATTQFDLDDILCSNYTQTCPELLASEDDDPMMNMLVRQSDAENNSVSTPFRIQTLEPKSTKIQPSSSSFATVESQTQTSRYPKDTSGDRERNQILMDIETQTSSSML